VIRIQDPPASFFSIHQTATAWTPWRTLRS
jgi:hypothetical protein